MLHAALLVRVRPSCLYRWACGRCVCVCACGCGSRVNACDVYFCRCVLCVCVCVMRGRFERANPSKFPASLLPLGLFLPHTTDNGHKPGFPLPARRVSPSPSLLHRPPIEAWQHPVFPHLSTHLRPRLTLRFELGLAAPHRRNKTRLRRRGANRGRPYFITFLPKRSLHITTCSEISFHLHHTLSSICKS